MNMDRDGHKPAAIVNDVWEKFIYKQLCARRREDLKDLSDSQWLYTKKQAKANLRAMVYKIVKE